MSPSCCKLGREYIHHLGWLAFLSTPFAIQSIVNGLLVVRVWCRTRLLSERGGARSATAGWPSDRRLVLALSMKVEYGLKSEKIEFDGYCLGFFPKLLQQSFLSPSRPQTGQLADPAHLASSDY